MMFRGAISRLIHLQVSCASIFGLRLPMSKRGLTTVRVNSPPIFASSFSSTCADVHLVPMFEDNYGFIIVDKHSGKSACIDPGDGVVMADALRKLQLNLTMVWCTHKHMDHIGGVADLKRVFPGATVYGTKYETVPKLEVPVGDKDKFQLGELLVEVPASSV